MKQLTLLIGAVCAMVLIAVLPSHGENDNVIHGCYQKNNGQLSIVGSQADCGTSENHILWNQTGFQGLQGEPGETGPPGVGGLDCWDLNGDRLCDMTTEDRNNDGICDALDCQGEPSPGSIRVNDASGNYLGMFIRFSGREISIHVPSLGKIITLNIETGLPPLSAGADLWYTIGGCPASEQLYIALEYDEPTAQYGAQDYFVHHNYIQTGPFYVLEGPATDRILRSFTRFNDQCTPDGEWPRRTKLAIENNCPLMYL